MPLMPLVTFPMTAYLTAYDSLRVWLERPAWCKIPANKRFMGREYMREQTSNPSVAGSNPAGRAYESPAKHRKLKEPKLPVLGPVAAVGQQ